eukprot:11177839-Lingulodinium_polyedra.AAC.1
MVNQNKWGRKRAIAASRNPGSHTDDNRPSAWQNIGEPHRYGLAADFHQNKNLGPNGLNGVRLGRGLARARPGNDAAVELARITHELLVANTQRRGGDATRRDQLRGSSGR